MRNVLAVFVGGAIGTLARFILDATIDRTWLVTPWMINIVGAFVLGVLVSSLWRLASTPDWLKAGLGTGVLGGFTTFSAIALLLTQAMAQTNSSSGLAGAALVLLIFVLTAVVGIAAAWAGLALGSRLVATTMSNTSPTASPIADEGVDL